MLASHNILNPANGAPIAVPSQDMVLGLYYMTKGRKSEPGHPMRGEGRIFYSSEEVHIAYNEGQIDLHSWIKVRWNNPKTGKNEMIETTVGRVLFNEVVPDEVGFINELLTKKSLRDIIGRVMKEGGTAKAAKFLDDIKELGFMSAFKGGLSFNLMDVVVPDEKEKLVKAAQSEVDEVMGNYNMGLITNNERYNQTIDIWTHTNSKLTFTLMERLKKRQPRLQLHLHDDGFRRAWFQGADPSAQRYAGTDGQAPEERRWRWTGHHREPDPLELQGGPVHPGVLHLHPRCP
jgi:DNA-directed RNA polymerase subunit beta'